MLFGTSAWDARPFSFASSPTPKPDYSNVQASATVGGPIKGWRVHGNRGTFFLAFQRTDDTNATTQSALLPTSLERAGDFSTAVDASGRPLTVIDPQTGAPFPGNRIPAERLSPAAQSLLAYYPAANVDAAGRFNYQVPVLSDAQRHNLQLRLTQPLNRDNQLSASVLYENGADHTLDLFRFADTLSASNLDAATDWNRRLAPSLSLRARRMPRM